MLPIYNDNNRMLKRYLQYEIDDNLVDFDAAYAKGVSKWRDEKVGSFISRELTILKHSR